MAVARIEYVGRSAAWGSALLATFGGALVAAGLLVGDPGLGYPPDAPVVVDHRSLHGTLHDVAGLIAFTSIVAATFVFARYFGVDRRSRPWAWYSAGTGLAVTAIAVIVVGLILAHGGTAVDLPVGTLQRIAIVAGWGWLALVAVRLQLATSAHDPTAGLKDGRHWYHLNRSGSQRRANAIAVVTSVGRNTTGRKNGPVPS
jgi:hypothetical protein